MGSIEIQQIANYKNQDMVEASTEYLTFLMGATSTCHHPIAHDFMQKNIRLIDVINSFGEKTSVGRFENASLDSRINQALTNSDFGIAMTSSIQKVVRRSYQQQNEHRRFLSLVEVKDFKPVEFPDLDIGNILKAVNENGEFDLTPISQINGESPKLSTWGANLNFSRELAYNLDSIDVLKLIGVKIGEIGSRLEAMRTYQVLESNPTMADGSALFDASKLNLMSTSSSSLDKTSLQEGMALLRKQPNVLGDKTNNVLRHIVCPVDDELMLLELIKNIGREKEITVTAAPWVESGWYMFADPELAPSIGLLQLEKSQTLSVGRFKNKIERPGFGLGFYADFQVAPLSRIGCVKVQL